MTREELAQYVANKFNDYNQAPGFVTGLKEGVQGIIHQFDNSRMVDDYLQGLQGLSDEEYQNRVNAGKVSWQDRIYAALPQELRDQFIADELAARTKNQDELNAFADYVTGGLEPHRAPEGIWENVSYYGGQAVPGIAKGLAELAALGLGGSVLANSYMGNRQSREQVYKNLLDQGYSQDEAMDAANSIGGNTADVATRMGTDLASLYLLQNPLNPASDVSPLSQTVRNILGASAISGAGAAGEQAITNYRSNIDNDINELAKTGVIAGGTTAGFGAVNAARNWRRIRDAQRLWRNRPFEAESLEVTAPELEAGDPALDAGENTEPPVKPAPSTPSGYNKELAREIAIKAARTGGESARLQGILDLENMGVPHDLAVSMMDLAREGVANLKARQQEARYARERGLKRADHGLQNVQAYQGNLAHDAEIYNDLQNTPPEARQLDSFLHSLREQGVTPSEAQPSRLREQGVTPSEAQPSRFSTLPEMLDEISGAREARETISQLPDIMDKIRDTPAAQEAQFETLHPEIRDLHTLRDKTAWKYGVEPPTLSTERNLSSLAELRDRFDPDQRRYRTFRNRMARLKDKTDSYSDYEEGNTQPPEQEPQATQPSPQDYPLIPFVNQQPQRQPHPQDEREPYPPIEMAGNRERLIQHEQQKRHVLNLWNEYNRTRRNAQPVPTGETYEAASPTMDNQAPQPRRPRRPQPPQQQREPIAMPGPARPEQQQAPEHSSLDDMSKKRVNQEDNIEKYGGKRQITERAPQEPNLTPVALNNDKPQAKPKPVLDSKKVEEYDQAKKEEDEIGKYLDEHPEENTRIDNRLYIEDGKWTLGNRAFGTIEELDNLYGELQNLLPEEDFYNALEGLEKMGLTHVLPEGATRFDALKTLIEKYGGKRQITEHHAKEPSEIEIPGKGIYDTKTGKTRRPIDNLQTRRWAINLVKESNSSNENLINSLAELGLSREEAEEFIRRYRKTNQAVSQHTDIVTTAKPKPESNEQNLTPFTLESKKPQEKPSKPNPPSQPSQQPSNVEDTGYNEYFLDKMDVDHMGKNYQTGVYYVEDDDNGDRYEIINKDGYTVAIYEPGSDEFTINPEYEKTPWVRNVEENFRRNKKALFNKYQQVQETQNLTPFQVNTPKDSTPKKKIEQAPQGRTVINLAEYGNIKLQNGVNKLRVSYVKHNDLGQEVNYLSIYGLDNRHFVTNLATYYPEDDSLDIEPRYTYTQVGKRIEKLFPELRELYKKYKEYEARKTEQTQNLTPNAIPSVDKKQETQPPKTWTDPLKIGRSQKPNTTTETVQPENTKQTDSKTDGRSIPYGARLKTGVLDISGEQIEDTYLGSDGTRKTYIDMDTGKTAMYTEKPGAVFKGIAKNTDRTITFYHEKNGYSPYARYHAKTDTFENLDTKNAAGELRTAILERKFREHIKEFYQAPDKPYEAGKPTQNQAPEQPIERPEIPEKLTNESFIAWEKYLKLNASKMSDSEIGEIKKQVGQHHGDTYVYLNAMLGVIDRNKSLRNSKHPDQPLAPVSFNFDEWLEHLEQNKLYFTEEGNKEQLSIANDNLKRYRHAKNIFDILKDGKDVKGLDEARLFYVASALTRPSTYDNSKNDTGKLRSTILRHVNYLADLPDETRQRFADTIGKYVEATNYLSRLPKGTKTKAKPTTPPTKQPEPTQPQNTETSTQNLTPFNIKEDTKTQPADTESLEKESPHKVLADQIGMHVLISNKLDNQDLMKMAAEAFGGTKGDGAFTHKEAYDAMEMGVNQAIQSLGINPAKADLDKAKLDLKRLNDMVNLLPTQNVRDDEQEKLQQFSTPPTLAYLANWLANVKKDDVVLEPSAGLGGLAVFAHNSGAKLLLNELSKRRADLLDSMNLGKVYREDARFLGDILKPKLKDAELPTKVIMNPPFSSNIHRIKNNTHNAEAHIEQALKLLKDDGRLVAILGKGMADNEPAFKKWWDNIKSQYNVRANVSLNGQLYRKYGTTFGNVMVVIDKTGATPENGTITGQFDNLEDVLTALKDIKGDTPTIKQTTPEKKTPVNVNNFKAAFDELNKDNKTFIRIPDMRKKLGWSREGFDNMLKYLRDNEVIQLHTGDASLMTLEESKDRFTDENGMMFGSMTWDRNLSQQELEKLEKSVPDVKATKVQYKVSANDFKTAYDKIKKGGGFARISEIRKELNWPHDDFDNMIKKLRDKEVIQLHTGDASTDNANDMFFDENNYRFGSITWERDLTQQEIKELERSDPKANVAKTSSSSNQSNTEAVVKPDEGTIKKVSEPKE